MEGHQETTIDDDDVTPSNIFIDNILKRLTTRRYEGIYACDNIPARIARLKYFNIICNLDALGKSGSHFVAIVGQPKKVIYIDPLGRPCTNRFITKFLRKAQQNTKKKNNEVEQHPNRNLEWLNVAMQDPMSSFCGYYCLLIILFFERRRHGIHINFDTDNLMSNDEKCIEYIKQFIHLFQIK